MERKIVKASLRHPARTCRCLDCGITFTAYGHADRCDPCRKRHRKEYQRKYIRPSRRKARRDREERRKAGLAGLGPLKGVSAQTSPAVTGRCRFCGKPVFNGASFCARCMREGFNEVYAVTGRTNGWDRGLGIPADGHGNR